MTARHVSSESEAGGVSDRPPFIVDSCLRFQFFVLFFFLYTMSLVYVYTSNIETLVEHPGNTCTAVMLQLSCKKRHIGRKVDDTFRWSFVVMLSRPDFR